MTDPAGPLGPIDLEQLRELLAEDLPNPLIDHLTSTGSSTGTGTRGGRPAAGPHHPHPGHRHHRPGPRRRLHGSLGMISPVEYEEAHYAARQAARSTTLEAAEIP
jgi:hypothetical protein